MLGWGMPSGAAAEGRGNGDQEHIGRLRRQLGGEGPGGHGRCHGLIEIGLNDVDLPLVDGGHHFRVDIDADDAMASTGQYGGRGQADVAEAEDAAGAHRFTACNNHRCTSSSSAAGIGAGPPERIASRKALQHASCPLSCARRRRVRKPGRPQAFKVR